MPFNMTKGARPWAARTPRTISDATHAAVKMPPTTTQVAKFSLAKAASASVCAETFVASAPDSANRVKAAQGTHTNRNSKP